ncbi:STAS domain-containing protein [Clostridium tagluense]|uniref:SulP family inorganic anion transporter n=1 Tax=Clostridium tagluense TaxID=360422 RepID=UPI001C0CFA85|nr:SulP family inorganic anion transporter [Clostridium tagluense]MBU3127302.1 STAS domain-containing protein [Clostridium tagluense]MCB2311224.1 STAS domain-containing protein [Clostridium tagluense]MCB2315948.1 STAS domain-containing protein [Clostridium tagluense]MCB2320705.1 STAS domain-containing protein [Clostridium tagluense]MCB2325722.1 STAS domain-containing protein [Clostridium tagluense]
MFVPKLFTCLKTYSKDQFVKDFIAGIIVAIIALPLAIALAIASGVSPEKGIYTAIVGGFIVSLLGGSRVQIGGPTGAFVVIVFGIIEKFGIDGLIVATIMAGFFLIIMGFFKFGGMLKFIPYPITTGFTSGIAVIIFSTQIKDFFGLTMKTVPSDFIPKWCAYFNSFSTLNLQSMLMGVFSLLIIIFWPKINKKIPGTLIAIVLTTIITLLFNLNIETIGSRFGDISSSLPAISLPHTSFAMIKELMLPALTIAILGSIESLLSAVVADGMIGGSHRSNMELVAQGVANICSGLVGGIPVTGAIARTAANVKNGGRTPIAGIVHSLALLMILLVCMPYVKLVPMSSLAAILIIVSYNMGEWEAFQRILKAPKSDAIVLLVTFSLTIFFDLVIAIGIGLLLASLLFMKRMADVSDVRYILDEYEDKDQIELIDSIKTPENVSLYEINGPFFFGAADKFMHAIREIGIPTKILIVKMSNVPAMDATGYHALEMLYDICKKHHTHLIMLNLQSQPTTVLGKYGFIDALGVENICNNIDEAIERANILLEKPNALLKI